jgi:hypothetical protein
VSGFVVNRPTDDQQIRDRMLMEQAASDRQAGYSAGWDLASPVPDDDHSAEYRHGFACARADRACEQVRP